MKNTILPKTSQKKQSELNVVQDYTTTITILEHLSDAIFILNAEGNVEYANSNALDMLRLKLESLITRRLDDFIQELAQSKSEESSRNKSFVKNILNGAYNEMETVLHNNGYRTPVVLSFGIVRDPHGGVNYIICSAKDLTIKAEFERELGQYKMLADSREKYKELGDLAVNVVHELSQPLTTVRLMTELTGKLISKPDFDRDRVNGNLQKIMQMTEKMTGSIERVRSFAMQTEDDSLKQINLEKVLTEAVEQIAYELSESNIEIDVKSDKELPSVMANPMALQQVFVSLIKKHRHELDKLPDKSEIKKLKVWLQNIDNKWIQLIFSTQHSDCAPLSKQREDLKLLNTAQALDRGLDLSMVQIVVSSFGGDLSVAEYSKNCYAFMLRLPADQTNERDQLLNLIELFHG